MTSPNDYPRLLLDVGGTNVRFASQLAPQAPLVQIARYACADFATLTDAVRHHIGKERLAVPRSAAMGIATPITGDAVRMTNHHWAFSIAALQEELGLERLVVVNDFTALALSLLALPTDALRQVGTGQAVAGAAVGLVGAGTGLGVSGLLPTPGGGYAAISGEGGHATLSAETSEEAAVLQALQRRFGHASAERVLSGPGLENLYQALAEVRCQAAPTREAAHIVRAGLQGGEGLCLDTLKLFCALLGSVAGNLALTLGARGGLFIGGGIVPRLGEWFDRSPFRARFEAKGRFAAYLQTVPTWLIVNSDEAALLGACRALEQ